MWGEMFHARDAGEEIWKNRPDVNHSIGDRRVQMVRLPFGAKIDAEDPSLDWLRKLGAGLGFAVVANVIEGGDHAFHLKFRRQRHFEVGHFDVARGEFAANGA